MSRILQHAAAAIAAILLTLAGLLAIIPVPPSGAVSVMIVPTVA